VTSLTAIIVLQAALLSTGQTYAEAHKSATASGQPLVILVGADWCPACREMKHNVIPRVARDSELTKVSFTMVDIDRQERLAGRLMSGESIPQLIMFYRDGNEWKRHQLTGGQSVATFKAFLAKGTRTARSSRRVQR
jgi:thiol-disulfide isomerase/thioredoxin